MKTINIFEDSDMVDYVNANIDINKDGLLNQSEIESVKEINVGGKNITSGEGFWIFTNLERLDCSNTLITELDLEYMKLKELNVSNCSVLKELWCCGNELTLIDVSGCVSMVEFECNDNNIEAIDVSDMPLLEEFWCSENNISELDLTQNSGLKRLYCDTNPLASLNLSNNTDLEYINCKNCLIATLNLSANKKITTDNIFTDEEVEIIWNLPEESGSV